MPTPSMLAMLRVLAAWTVAIIEFVAPFRTTVGSVVTWPRSRRPRSKACMLTGFNPPTARVARMPASSPT
jgi:hypothetical protein